MCRGCGVTMLVGARTSVRLRLAVAALIPIALFVAAGPAAGPVAAGPAAGPVAAAGPATPAQRAAAIAAPAMVNVQVSWEGWVRNVVTGELVDEQSITATVHCGGIAVSSDGYLVTAGHCVDPTIVAMSFYQQAVARRVAKGLLTADQVQPAEDDLLINGSVIGRQAGSAATRTITVRREVTPDDELPATVVSIAQPATADVAILKIEKTNQPIVTLAGDPSVGGEVVTVEYTADAGTSDRPTARAGSVARTEPALMTYAGPADPSSGGSVLTLDGDLVGVVSLHQPVTSTDLVAPSSAIAKELELNEVLNTLGPVDRDYRAGLDAFYGGRYTESIEKFDAVLAIIPSHRQAHDLRDEAQALRDAEGGGQPAENGMLDSVTGWLGGALGPIAAAALVAGLGLVLVRRRNQVKEPAPAETAAETEAAETEALAPAGARSRARLATPDYCANCSNAVPTGAETCPTCGQPRA
jgi:serine protease Do